MTQNEQFAALKAANDALKASTATSFAELNAAVAAIKTKLGALGDITPENKVIADGLISDATALGASLKTAADSVRDVASGGAVVEP